MNLYQNRSRFLETTIHRKIKQNSNGKTFVCIFYLDNFLLFVEPGLQIFNVELKQIKRRRSRLPQHAGKPDVAGYCRVELNPQRH